MPPPSANARRSLAAERIAAAIPRDNLSPVPFVPYSLSLALSVEYRKMRHSRLPMFRARARLAFKSNCELLRNFGDVFWSARVVSNLGERMLREMERAANSLANEVTPLPADHSLMAASSKTLAGTCSIVAEGGQSLTQPRSPIPPNDRVLGLESLDLSLFDAMPDLDVFGHFDPNFNLDAMDDALEANLDLGLPPNWGDWDYAAI